MAYTRLGPFGYSSRNYGSFVGKAEAEVVVPPTDVIGGAGRIVYVRQKKKKDHRHPIDRMLDSVVREMYEAVTGENVPPEVREEAASEVRAFIKPSIPKAKVPTAPAIDWVALAGDMARVERLLALWQIQLEKIREDEDDEDMLLLMGW